jgi:phospho-N-acetylmuramoyl-pentapeptide-transferase
VGCTLDFLPLQVIVFIIMFALSALTGILMIPVLKKLKAGQNIRNDGPQSHLIKAGTPTIGGLIFIIPLIAVTAVLALKHPGLIYMSALMVLFAGIGFADDYVIVIKKSNKGLSPKQKMLALVIVSLGYALYAALFTDADAGMVLWFFIPFTVFVLVSEANAVNLTDGLDGLAGGVTLIVMIFFTVISNGLPDRNDAGVFSSMVAGGCLGFLIFNVKPAKVMMGNTGALALGGAVAVSAISMRIPWILLIAGGIYLIEALSVIIQVASFKKRGKRVFRMAPLHHHFELSGWTETKVVYVFWGAQVIFCLLSFLILRI